MFCAPVCVLGRKSSHRGGRAAREREGGRGSSTEDLFLALALVDGRPDPAGGRASPLRAARGANEDGVTFECSVVSLRDVCCTLLETDVAVVELC